MKNFFVMILFATVSAIILMSIIGLLQMGVDYTFGVGCFKEKTKTQLAQPPNYDKESLLGLLEKGECIVGTIDEGKFSVFVCKN